eukprot:3124629-Pyramimonas_sp.AAC.1
MYGGGHLNENKGSSTPYQQTPVCIAPSFRGHFPRGRSCTSNMWQPMPTPRFHACPLNDGALPAWQI